MSGEYTGPVVKVTFRNKKAYQKFFDQFSSWLVDPVFNPDKAGKAEKEMEYGPLGFYVPRHWEFGDPMIEVDNLR